MRRSFALLALFATSWPHVSALQCVLGTSDSAHEVASVAGRHGPPTDPNAAEAIRHEEHGHLPGDGTSPHSGAPECGIVMACGMAMIEAVSDAAALRPRLPLVGSRPVSAHTPSAAVLVADPPPPRRHA